MFQLERGLPWKLAADAAAVPRGTAENWLRQNKSLPLNAPLTPNLVGQLLYAHYEQGVSVDDLAIIARRAPCLIREALST